MAPAVDSSNIRAFVHWNQPTIYSGEEIECIITFKNIAQKHDGRLARNTAGSYEHLHQGGQYLHQHAGSTATTTPRTRPAHSSLRDSRRASYAQSAAAALAAAPRRSNSTATNKTALTRGFSRGGQQSQQIFLQTQQSPQPSKGHRPALSLNVVSGSTRAIPLVAPSYPSPVVGGGGGFGPTGSAAAAEGGGHQAKGHGRSLSIISMGGDKSTADMRSAATAHANSGSTTPVLPGGGGRRPGGHVRSASLQHMPRLAAASPSAIGFPSPRQPSPLYEAITPPAILESPTSTQPAPSQPQQQLPARPGRRKNGTMSAGNTPQLGHRPSLKKHGSTDSYGSGPAFRFPSTAPLSTDSSANPTTISPNLEMPKPVRTPSNMHSSQTRHFSPRPFPSSDSAGALAAAAPSQSWTNTLPPPNNLNPLTRIMSASSIDGTPRSSSEIYTMSNHSDETLTSEVTSHLQAGNGGGGGRRPGPYKSGHHSRQASRSPQTRPMPPRPPEEETLMMAYAQTQGFFTLDGSLVNATPFEEVKRKGIQGVQGGGVVGVEKLKRNSGMFGGFSWGAIGESLGGLLVGSDEMSTLAQMKASASSKAIPLLSTPQSLLFVDLTLAPGESRSYSYRFALPRGLPPSYRGRGIKVAYHLSLGVQRPEGQTTRHVDVPFRVLGSYDARGESLAHDLMQPYVLLQDSARTVPLGQNHPSSTSEAGGDDADSATTHDSIDHFPHSHPPPSPLRFLSALEPKAPRRDPQQGLEDFLRYTERLLALARDVDENGNTLSSSAALLSPTSPSVHTLLPLHTLPSPSASRQGSLALVEPPPGAGGGVGTSVLTPTTPNATTTREAIDLAIMRANIVRQPGSRSAAASHSSPSPATQADAAAAPSANRFNIARAGQPIAILTLLRPAYRLGEAVIGVLDFTSLSSPSTTATTTYTINIELESSETVDPSLALRSAASIHRVSRKVHAAAREKTLFARRIAFHLPIPATATPGFVTTGVNVEWRLRIEFTTQRAASASSAGGGEKGLGIDASGDGADDRIMGRSQQQQRQQDGETLLEVLSSDERGTTLLAREHLLADAFEIAVPLRVLGAVVVGGGGGGTAGAGVESLEGEALEL